VTPLFGSALYMAVVVDATRHIHSVA